MIEKHRTCQKEVAGRDQSILKLQSELETAQQQYQGSLEEVRSALSGLHHLCEINMQML